jgi:hypothetical protein
MYIGSPFVANAPLKCGRRLLHSTQRWTSRSQTGKQFPNDADSAWSSAEAKVVTWFYDVFLLLLATGFLPVDGVHCFGCGNFSQWPHSLYRASPERNLDWIATNH